MPSPFAENEVEVLHRDLPDALNDKLRRARAELQRTLKTGILSPSDFDDLKKPLNDARLKKQQRQAIKVNDARERVLSVWRRAFIWERRAPAEGPSRGGGDPRNVD